MNSKRAFEHSALGLAEWRLIGAPLMISVLLTSTRPFGDGQGSPSRIGDELAVPRHLQDDEEFRIPLKDLLEYGKKLFMADWTVQDGAGRPLTKGDGTALSDPK